MTSITQLLSPWPVSKHSIVLREQHYPPPPSDTIDNMQQHQPSSPNDPSNNDAVTGSAESDGGDNNSDGRKGYGKRELSTSKRAAQNRAAQVWLSFEMMCRSNVALADRTFVTRELFDNERRATSRSWRSKYVTIKS